MSLPVVYSTHPLHPSAGARLAGRCELRIATAVDLATLAREGREADIVIVRANLPPELFAQAPRLRAAIRHGAGLDMIPVEAATAAGVLVANVPGVNAQSVAEYAMFAALALVRRFRRIDGDLRGRGWEAGRAHAPFASELRGRTLGLIGLGHIGKAVAAIALNGFGMAVQAYTPRSRSYPPGIAAVDLDAVFHSSDIVVLACPLTAETRGLANAARLASMKPTSVLVNVSRGPVLDEAALVAALAEGRISGAALDVFGTQPLPPDHPLLRFDTVILTPHLAGITEDSMERMGQGAVVEAIRVLNNVLPLNFVNPEVTEAYRRRFPAR